MKKIAVVCLLLASQHAWGFPPSVPLSDSDLPGKTGGKIESYWIRPYVKATRNWVKDPNLTVEWFSPDGKVLRKATAISIDGGVIDLPGVSAVQSIDETWKLNLPVKSDDAYEISTMDGRTLVMGYEPKAGYFALDVYSHGKLAHKVGPFVMHALGEEGGLNADGSQGLIIWKDESKQTAQVLAIDPKGAVRFRVDCDPVVWSPIAAPGAAGVLVRPNAGGDTGNTFMWYTEKGKLHSLDISPNPYLTGWVPGTAKSLFSTGPGGEVSHYSLVDWDAGQKVWEIPCPGGGEALAIGFTPDLILFAVAEPYKAGPWRGEKWSLRDGAKEWVRAFYAISVQDGSQVARWQAEYPQRFVEGEHGEAFYQEGGKLFYVTDKEFTEIDPADIASKKNGWK